MSQKTKDWIVCPYGDDCPSDHIMKFVLEKLDVFTMTRKARHEFIFDLQKLKTEYLEKIEKRQTELQNKSSVSKEKQN